MSPFEWGYMVVSFNCYCPKDPTLLFHESITRQSRKEQMSTKQFEKKKTASISYKAKTLLKIRLENLLSNHLFDTHEFNVL